MTQRSKVIYWSLQLRITKLDSPPEDLYFLNENKNISVPQANKSVILRQVQLRNEWNQFHRKSPVTNSIFPKPAETLFMYRLRKIFRISSSRHRWINSSSSSSQPVFLHFWTNHSNAILSPAVRINFLSATFWIWSLGSINCVVILSCFITNPSQFCGFIGKFTGN